MRYQVSVAQLQGWHHPLVLAVVEAANAEGPQGSLKGLAADLADTVMNHGLWSGFLPLPFTADSVQGQRITAAWREVQKTFPHSGLVQMHFWKFWRPVRDAAEALFVDRVLNRQPIFLDATA